jgi:poly(3-hydroxyalkanoate) synthetase
VLRRGAGLVAELGMVGLGTSALAPHGGDGRFAGRADDPLRRRAVQAYLATTGALSGLLDDATDGGAGLNAADEARLRAVLDALADLAGPAVAGTPTPPEPDPVPEPAGPVPGRDTAATPGAVVLRTPMFELIQYLPRTVEVRDVPVLVVPPLAHRYYLVDLAPGHSLVEHLVGEGLQVFVLSWPDPAPEVAAGRDLDTYAAAVLDAVEACTRITRCPRVALAGVRTGGLLSAAVQCHLDAIGRGDRVAAAVYLGTVLDQRSAMPGFRPEPVPARAGDGVLDGSTAVRSWSWRRGGEQVRPFAVDPAAADRLPPGPARRALRRWASDLLHVPAALQADLLALAADDPDHPGTTVLGTPVEPHRPACDTYLVTPADDPAQPWTAGLRTAQLLGGPCRLVRACGGQAAALAAPDGFVAGPVPGEGSPAEWQAGADRGDGSWWPDLAAWLAERTGTVREAPPELGGRRMHPVDPAPGVYLGG